MNTKSNYHRSKFVIKMQSDLISKFYSIFNRIIEVMKKLEKRKNSEKLESREES